MHEFKHGEIQTSAGRQVKNPKQAIAIGLHEAGASKYESESKEQSRRNLKRTKARERRGATGKRRSERHDDGKTTRAELYAEARRQNLPGRSKMSKKTTPERSALTAARRREADRRRISPKRSIQNGVFCLTDLFRG